MGKIYLYLGKRDKKGIKILTIFPGKELNRARVSDIESLHLSPDMQLALSKIKEEHKFLWEVWIESAADFNELRNKLEKRGYKNIPLHAEQLQPLRQIYNAQKMLDVSAFRGKEQTMLERNSRKNLSSSNTNLRNREGATSRFNY